MSIEAVIESCRPAAGHAGRGQPAPCRRRPPPAPSFSTALQNATGTPATHREHAFAAQAAGTRRDRQRDLHQLRASRPARRTPPRSPPRRPPTASTRRCSRAWSSRSPASTRARAPRRRARPDPARCPAPPRAWASTTCSTRCSRSTAARSTSSSSLDAFGGDVTKALAAYNAGPGAVQRFGGVPALRRDPELRPRRAGQRRCLPRRHRFDSVLLRQLHRRASSEI